MIDGQPQPHQVYVPHLNLRICYLVRPSPQEGLSLRVWYAKSLLWLTDRYFTFGRSVSARGAANKKLMTITIHRVVIIIIARITAWSAAGIAAGVRPRGKTAGKSVDAHISESDKESCGTGSMGVGFLCSCSLIWSIFRTYIVVCGGKLPGSATWTVNVSESPEQINR